MMAKRWQRYERRYAKKLGAKLQPASGAVRRPSLKGDGRGDTFIIDSKTTTAADLVVTAPMLDKLCRQTPWDKVPALIIRTADSERGLVPAEGQQPTMVVGRSVRISGSTATGTVIRFKRCQFYQDWVVIAVEDIPHE